MSTVASLLKRVRTVERHVSPPRGPRQWSVTLEAGETIPDEIACQFQRGDKVLIIEFPACYDVAGPEDPVRCTATSWPLHGSSKDMRHNHTIVVEVPRNTPLLSMEETGFTRRVSQYSPA